MGLHGSVLLLVLVSWPLGGQILLGWQTWTVFMCRSMLLTVPLSLRFFKALEHQLNEAKA